MLKLDVESPAIVHLLCARTHVLASDIHERERERERERRERESARARERESERESEREIDTQTFSTLPHMPKTNPTNSSKPLTRQNNTTQI